YARPIVLPEVRMPLFELDGKVPEVHPTAFVAPTATLVGEVVLEEGASVWYGARASGRLLAGHRAGGSQRAGRFRAARTAGHADRGRSGGDRRPPVPGARRHRRRGSPRRQRLDSARPRSYRRQDD